MRYLSALSLLLSSHAFAQDQQVGARAKAMGGSYTAFEDDPVSIWLNPAGIATQPSAVALHYQSYTLYELKISQTQFTPTAETGWSDPALIPSFLGVVFQVGDGTTEHSIGVCFSAPFRTKYVFDDLVSDFISQDAQSFYRFRVAYAHDFRLKDRSEGGWFTHISVGVGLDLALTHIEVEPFEEVPTTADAFDGSFDDLGFGGGFGLLIGVYDNNTTFKINFGAAYQSEARYDFSVSEAIIPLFDWPAQINGGVTLYLFEGMPLRVTLDAQILLWGRATDDSSVDNIPDFQDVLNFSIGAEYRIKASDTVRIFPRAGLRYYAAPWGSDTNLPAIGTHRLIIDTDNSHFVIFSLGMGVSWQTDSGKTWSVDIAGDFGGDAPGFAFGFTLEI